jgi:hypothetical protein
MASSDLRRKKIPVIEVRLLFGPNFTRRSTIDRQREQSRSSDNANDISSETPIEPNDSGDENNPRK